MGGMDVDYLCPRISGDSSLALWLSDLSDAMDAPEVGVLFSPLEDSSSEVTPAVGYSRLPLPSVDNSLMPDLVWVPALPQPTGRFVDRGCLVPRWWLAREGPFLEERSPESYPFIGAWLRLQEHYIPRVGLCRAGGGLRWIGVPQSAGLTEFSGSQWVDKLLRDQAVTAAVHLQRDVGLIQTNVDVLDSMRYFPRRRHPG